MNAIPNVLRANSAINEDQQTILNTIRLTPNSFANNSVVFVLPKAGSVLDHNSSLVWSVSWDGFNIARNTGNQLGATQDQQVCLKILSGALNTLNRARMYCGGRLLFENPDVAQVVHIDKSSTNPDHLCEVEDVKLGGNHDFFLNQSGGQSAKVKFAEGHSSATLPNPDSPLASNRLTRTLGSWNANPLNNKSFEATILLSDLFPALKGGLQIPINYLNDDIRIEVDFLTNFNECGVIVADAVNAITNTTLSINNPLLYLDYLSFDPMTEAGLAQSVASGISVPFRDISMMRQVIPPNTSAAPFTTDVFLGFQGKLLMKIYASHRFANVINGVRYEGDVGNGRCRSDMGGQFSYNLIVNDLHLYDQNVDSASQQYNGLSLCKQYPVYVYPGSYTYNLAARFRQAANTQEENQTSFDCGGTTAAAANNGLSATACRDMITGTQAYLGFDLSKYGQGIDINPNSPANAGYRVGSTPVILRIIEVGGAATTREGAAKTIDVFAESVKVMVIKNGMVDVVEA